VLPLETTVSVYLCIVSNGALRVVSFFLVVVCLAFLFLLHWAIGRVCWTAQHPFKQSRRGTVFLSCERTNDGSIPVLHLSVGDDGCCSVQDCFDMAVILSPALANMRWGLWLFHTLVTACMREIDAALILQTLPAPMRTELEAFASGARQHAECEMLRRWGAREWIAIQCVADLHSLIARCNPHTGFVKRLLGWLDALRLGENPIMGCTTVLCAEGVYRSMVCTLACAHICN
jgi:hypothetical protein